MQFKTGKYSNKIDLNKTLNVSNYLMTLSKGLYVLRYQNVFDGGHVSEEMKVPLALSRAPIDLDGSVEFIGPDDTPSNVLHGPGDYCVIKVTGDVVINISKFLPARLADKIQIKWNLESLEADSSLNQGRNTPKSSNSLAELAAPSSAASRTSIKPRPAPMKITGHIENAGDVTVKENEWLGHPFNKTRLEGITLQWINKPAKLDIRSVCMVEGRMLQATSGELLGTVRQGKAISELAFVLEGDNAEQYELSGEIAFSDGRIVPIKERERLVSGQGSFIVGARLAVTKKSLDSAEVENPVDAFLSAKQPKSAPQTTSANAAGESEHDENYSIWLDTKRTKVIQS
ncbi:hypothetical protein MGA5115_03118 [Marinomonas gallaica]|uniref:Uncharacterized protein n=1 Tax=Marinomonas gallaica TaxID=1806667 RepID=A0A1C3JUY5_9GAMM|nr:hypothetical protein [Marinomonas gallaica]SBT18957.1 hypothetical protein MGA5115_03118 [Marinomonas gallaica]SBT21912.1 hypothetical protein MGA5116_02522 [Marinomonas gallaica]